MFAVDIFAYLDTLGLSTAKKIVYFDILGLPARKTSTRGWALLPKERLRVPTCCNSQLVFARIVGFKFLRLDAYLYQRNPPPAKDQYVFANFCEKRKLCLIGISNRNVWKLSVLEIKKYIRWYMIIVMLTIFCMVHEYLWVYDNRKHIHL